MSSNREIGPDFAQVDPNSTNQLYFSINQVKHGTGDCSCTHVHVAAEQELSHVYM